MKLLRRRNDLISVRDDDVRMKEWQNRSLGGDMGEVF